MTRETRPTPRPRHSTSAPWATRTTTSSTSMSATIAATQSCRTRSSGGAGGTPSFPAGGYAFYQGVDLQIGGHVFSKGGQQYLLTAGQPGDCNTTTLYTVDGVSNLGFINCVEIGGTGPLLKGLRTTPAPPSTSLPETGTGPPTSSGRTAPGPRCRSPTSRRLSG